MIEVKVDWVWMEKGIEVLGVLLEKIDAHPFPSLLVAGLFLGSVYCFYKYRSKCSCSKITK